MSDYRDLPATTRAPLPPSLEAQLQRELQPGERVVWVGRPTLSWARRRAIPGVVFASLWYGFLALFAYLGSNVGSILAFTALFGIVGLFVVLAFLADLMSPYRSFYAVTDRRALLVRGPRRQDVRSLRPGEIGPRLVERAADGDVVLALELVPGESGWEEVPVGFLGIADARAAHAHVVNLVREAQAEREPNLPEPAELAEPEADEHLRRQRR